MRSVYGFDSPRLCDTSRCDVATHVPPKNFRSMMVLIGSDETPRHRRPRLSCADDDRIMFGNARPLVRSLFRSHRKSGHRVV